MKSIIIVLLLGGALCACSKPSNPSNAPVNTEQNRAATAETPQKSGDNSFTSDQATGHLVNAGYSNVTGLTQDANGVWHGTATKDGKSGPVSVDYTGAVTPG